MIYHEDSETRRDFKEVLHPLREESWDICFANTRQATLRSIKETLEANETPFLVFCKPLNYISLSEIFEIRSNFPLLNIIYYYHSLKNKQFIYLYEAGITTCIIGDNRQQNLVLGLQKLWKNHWKRISPSVFQIAENDLSPRAKRILNFIEIKPLRMCNIKAISSHLNISESHCRAEFKNLLGMNFRQFKRHLFSYYEKILLFKLRLKPNTIFEILDYKNISGYSRSFKKRHGHSYRESYKN